ncbi:MAG TPA: carboxypeptidase-like regulatory domain-containing protein, partial [Verrucomicrobiae bacterium]|nr:carboxypeptidase-like regulatory domain-containing protein [Verrucomicrobiae bacterium]
WLNTMDHGRRRSTNAPPQADFNRSADANGILVWNSAPEGELTFRVSRRGYMDSEYVQVKADESEKTIVLLPAFEISGKVQDETGQPIQRFRMICGWPDRDAQKQIIGTRWSTIERFWLNFSGGEFRHVLEEPLVVGTSNPGYRFKIEAEGYEPFISRPIEPTETKVKLDVTLRRAGATFVTVWLPDGQPAANADVGLVAAGSSLELVPGGFSRANIQDLTALLRTDARGQFQFYPEPERDRVVVAHPRGYAEVLSTTLSNEPRIQLQPWARIEGAYKIDGQPAPDRALTVDLAHGSPNTVRCGGSFEVKTDSEGRFIFPLVPPGRIRLMEWVAGQSGAQSVRTGSSRKEVSVEPGQTLWVDLGGKTYRVTARIRVAGDLQLPSDAVTQYLLWPSTGNTPDHSSESVGRICPLKGNSDGTWTARELMPGQYVFQIHIASRENPGVPLTSGHSTAVMVPAAVPDAPIDFGEIVLGKAE